MLKKQGGGPHPDKKHAVQRTQTTSHVVSEKGHTSPL